MKHLRRLLCIAAVLLSAIAAHAACPSNATCVDALATGGSGTSASPWTGWETSVNALPAMTHVHFSAGYYSQSTKITMKKGWLVDGDGGYRDSSTSTGTSYIVSSFTGTAFYFTGTGNGDGAGIRIEHLAIVNTNSSNDGSAIITRLTAIVHISNVWIEGFRFGYTNLGTTSWSVQNSMFEFQGRIGIWNCNGADYKSPYAGEDYSGTSYSYANDNASILNCTFNNNGSQTSPTAAIVLESTYANTIDYCKFNGSNHAIWITASNNMRISGSTFEAQTSQMIDLRQSRLLSGTSSGYSGGVVISNNLGTVSTAGVHFVNMDQQTDLTLMGNSYSDSTGISMIHQASGTLNTLNSFGNSYSSGGLCDATPVNGISSDLTSQPLVTLTGVLGVQTGLFQPARMGTATLGTGGTVTVSNSSVTSKTRVFYFRKTISGTTGDMSYTTTAGTSFTLTSANAADRSTFDYFLVEGP